MTNDKKVNHNKCQEISQSITMSVQHSVINYGKRPTFLKQGAGWTG